MESISSPEWELLEENMGEKDEPTNLDVDGEREWVEAAGMSSACKCAVNY